MPMYLFNILHDDEDRARDDEGQEFPDMAAARENALTSLREIAAETVKSGGKIDSLSIEISDDGGAVLDTLHAKDHLI